MRPTIPLPLNTRLTGGSWAKCPPIHVLGPLMGEYGTDAEGTLRTGNIAYVRLKEYLCNRVDQTEWSVERSARAPNSNQGSGAAQDTSMCWWLAEGLLQ